MYDRLSARDAESDHDGPNAVTAPRKQRAFRKKAYDSVRQPLRDPPHSTEAEQSVLGALLLDNTALGRISDILTVDDFYDGTHRALFGAIAGLITEGRPADVVTVADELTSVDKLEYIGGMTYLRSLVEEVPTAANIRAYGLTVRDRAQRRRLAAVGIEISDLAMGTAAHDSATLLDDAAEKVDQLRVDANASSSMRRALNWPVLAERTPPARDWAIASWLGMRYVTLLAGPGGIGKSLLAQQIGSALALQRDFIDVISVPRKVLMWAAEDDEDELWRRQLAIAGTMRVALDDFSGMFVVESFDGKDCTLAAEAFGRFEVTAKLEELRQQFNDEHADVLILDNIARMFGGKENDRHHVTTFIAELTGITAERRGAVLLLGHPGRAKGSEFSGSSAWENAVRARLWLSDKLPDQERDDDEEPASDVRFLARRKANYSPRDLREFRYQNGLFVPAQGEPVTGDLMDHSRRLKANRVILDAFRKLGTMGQAPSDGASSPSYLPKLALDYKLAEGLTKRELADAMRRQMVDGFLVREQIGTYGNRNPRFGLKEL